MTRALALAVLVIMSASTYAQTADTNAPRILSVRGDPFDLTKVYVRFDEPVIGAENVSNWLFEPKDSFNDTSNAVVRAAISAMGTKVTLTIDPPRDDWYKYVLSLVCCEIHDAAGNILLDGTWDVEIPKAFRQGFNGYMGAHDTQLRADAPDTAGGALTEITADLADPALEVQGLLRFDDIFGNNVGQVPPCSCINSAKLRLYVVEPSTSPVRILRLKVPWDEASTWNSLGNGIDQTNGIETAGSSIIAEPLNVACNFIDLDVTEAVRAWTFGESSSGWAFLATSTDGWRFASSDYQTVEFRPVLTIDYYIVLSPCHFISTPQSVSVLEGYPFSLSVTGSPPAASYQWFKNGIAIPDATNQTYVVAHAALSDQGTYKIGVHNDCNPCCASRDATVTVCPPNLRIRYEGGAMARVSWSSACGGVLQSSDVLGGQWQDVVTASPFLLPASGTQKFFRLRPPP